MFNLRVTTILCQFVDLLKNVNVFNIMNPDQMYNKYQHYTFHRNKIFNNDEVNIIFINTVLDFLSGILKSGMKKVYNRP